MKKLIYKRKIKELKEEIENNEIINYLDLIFLPLMNSDQDMSEIWRDYKMVKFFKYIEEQGKKEGEKKGEKNCLKN